MPKANNTQAPEDQSVDTVQQQPTQLVAEGQTTDDNTTTSPVDAWGKQTGTSSEVTVPTEDASTKPDTVQAGTPPTPVLPTTDTTAPLEPWMNKPGEPVTGASTNQSPETLAANDPVASGRPVVGKVITLLTDAQLEEEVMGEKFGDIENWITDHFNKRDASIDAMARVARMRVNDVKNVLKDAGFKFPQGF